MLESVCLNQFLSIFKIVLWSVPLIVVFIDLNFAKYKTDEDKKLHTCPKVRVIVNSQSSHGTFYLFLTSEWLLASSTAFYTIPYEPNTAYSARRNPQFYHIFPCTKGIE